MSTVGSPGVEPGLNEILCRNIEILGRVRRQAQCVPRIKIYLVLIPAESTRIEGLIFRFQTLQCDREGVYISARPDGSGGIN